MGIRIEERFEIAASPDSVWSYLIDPARVVRCLPGAELLETAEDGSFIGRVKVKVGPVVAAYRGRARFVEQDAVGRRARLTGEGQEASGAGSARMSMTSEITELAGGGAAVRVDVDVDVVGKLAQFGRGMIEEVSRQLFRQFSECVRAALEPASMPSAAESVAATSDPASRVPDSVSAMAPAPRAQTAGAAVSGSAAAPPPPLRLFPVLLAALRAWIRRALRRAR